MADGAIVSENKELKKLDISGDLTVEGDVYASLAEAFGSGSTVIAVDQGTFTETRNVYTGSISMYGVEGAIISGSKNGTVNTSADGGGVMKLEGSENLISGMTFFDNSISCSPKKGDNGGGVIWTNKSLTIENSVFDQNSSNSTAGAVLIGRGGSLTVSNSVFQNNTSSVAGGALKIYGSADFYGVSFTGNESTGNYGGAVSVLGSGTTYNFKKYGNKRTVFQENKAYKNGGAICVDGGGIYVEEVEFTGNYAADCGGAIAVLASSDADSYISGSTFTGNKVGASDTDFGGALYIGNNTNGNTVYLKNLTFDGNSAAKGGGAIYVVANASACITGLLTLKQATDSIFVEEGGNLTVSAADFLTDGALFAKVIDTQFTGEYFTGNLTVADGYKLIENRNDRYIALDSLSLANDAVYVGKSENLYAVTANGETSLYELYSDVDAAFNSGNDNVIFTAGTYDLEKRIIVSGKTITAAESGAIISGKGIRADNVMISGMTFTGNEAVSGAAITIDSGVNVISDSVFDSNTATAANNAAGAMVAVSGGTMTIENSKFTNAVAPNNGRGGAVYANSCTLNLNNIYSENNAGNYAWWFNSNATVTIENSTFKDSVISRGTVTIAGDVDLYANFAFTAGTVTVDGTLIFNTGLKLTHCAQINFGENSKLVFRNSSAMNFSIHNNACGVMDLRDTTVVVDNPELTSGAVIASGVCAIGKYTITGNKELMLTVNASNKLVLTKMAELELSGSSVVGSEANLIASGTAANFIANKTAAADNLLTTVKGGTITQNLVGGAYAKFAEVGKAVIGNVELNIGGTAEVAAKVYAGGYLYGNGAESAEAQMTVKSVNITLDGGAVSTNLFGGAHARQNGNASVTEVNITVTKGSHGRIHAGGWAEKGAVSSVGTSTVIISGGTVDYLYGGGANADGTTTVGTTTITIENSALVNTVFMSGRYGYSSVSGTVTLNYNSTTGMKRLSGVSSAGVDNAKNTVVNVLSNLTADLIDYVDKFVISENCKLTANDAFYLGNRLENGETDGFTTFEITAAESGWEVISGLSLDDFDYAKFIVNGSELTAWGDVDTLELGGCALTRSDADNDGKYIIAISK